MKLLFDENLSPSLVAKLVHEFPGSSHVHLLALGETEDHQVWHYATSNGFTLITKDSDFAEMSVEQGGPPKVIWIRIGNCKTSDVEALIRNHLESIVDFDEDPSANLLILR